MFNNPFDEILKQYEKYPPNNLVNMADKTWKPNIEIAPNCPRCASSNTKFCYYNNYSLSQPRYFCKSCRRYWTKGGSIRNVPIGGGCRKNRRSKAMKLPQSDRSSSSLSGYNSNSSQDPNEFNYSQKSGADIDLALVFANFLSPKSSSTSLDDNSSPNDIGVVEIQTQPNFVQEEDNLVIQKEKIGDQEIIMGNCNDVNMGHGFELQNLEMCEQEVGLNDAFWCDMEAMSSLSSWQLQDVDLFPSTTGGDDDRLQISTNNNLINENWSSFDFSGFQVFSRS